MKDNTKKYDTDYLDRLTRELRKEGNKEVKVLTKDYNEFIHKGVNSWEIDSNFLILYRVDSTNAVNLDEVIRFTIIEESD